MKGQPASKLRKISDENVHYILTAHPMSRPADLAVEVGTTEQTVRDIRANKMYRDMFPRDRAGPLLESDRGLRWLYALQEAGGPWCGLWQQDQGTDQEPLRV